MTARPRAAFGLIAVPLATLMLGACATGGTLPHRPGPRADPLASFDRLMHDLMRRWGVPGAALAVSRDGRLVLARGYGLADLERGEAVQPDSLFRIASVSKPITAVAVLKLVEDGRLDLEAPGLPLLAPDVADGPPVDPRALRITVRHLLQHAAGWDRARSGDPMFMPATAEAARASGLVPPADCATVIRWMLGRRLDFDPGTRHAYSNLGYCVLGRIIERVTGESYEAHVRRAVLAPAGITRMRMGRTLSDGRAEGEVRYYAAEPPAAAPVFEGLGRPPFPYGGFYLEGMDAHGGWIASANDLVRFITALDGSRGSPLLGHPMLGEMLARPGFEPGGAPTYYGLGWAVRPVRQSANWWHAGSLPGTLSLLVRTHHGLAWAVLLNSRPRQWQRLLGDLDRGLWKAAAEVSEKPVLNSFGNGTP